MKLAFVTPWYGPNIPGGAEALTRRTAERLHTAGMDVEVLTTCIKDFYGDWGQNYHQPGKDQVNGVTVRRFPVEKRNQQAFQQINWRLLNNLSVSGAGAAEDALIFEFSNTGEYAVRNNGVRGGGCGSCTTCAEFKAEFYDATTYVYPAEGPPAGPCAACTGPL